MSSRSCVNMFDPQAESLAPQDPSTLRVPLLLRLLPYVTPPSSFVVEPRPRPKEATLETSFGQGPPSVTFTLVHPETRQWSTLIVVDRTAREVRITGLDRP